MVKRRVYKNEGQPHVDASLVVTHSNIGGKGVHQKDMNNIDGPYQNSQLVLKSPRVGIALNI